MSVASFEPPPPRPPGEGGWSALEDNLLNKSSPQSGWDSCADEIYLKELVLHSCYGISMATVASYYKEFISNKSGVLYFSSE